MASSSVSPLIVAVSGGVDSVVLLSMLHAEGRDLVVAHVNHGIRPESDDDEAFVKQVAQSYGVSFVSTRLALGPEASEETARTARYSWLEQVRKRFNATAIATAHHQDDVLETMFINIARGTGWRGLCSLRSTARYERPLLTMSKAQIVAYALDHDLDWHEDTTNESTRYLRNRIRHLVVPRLTTAQRASMLAWYESQRNLRDEIDKEGARLIAQYSDHDGLRRYPLSMVDDMCGRELFRSWLGESLESARIDDLLLFAKVASHGAKWSLDAKRFVVADKQRLIVLPPRD